MARFLLISAVQDWLRCLAKEHSLNTRVVLVALSLAGYGLFGTLANEWARPVAVQEATYGMSIEAPRRCPMCVAAAIDCGAADGHAARGARGATRRLCGRLIALSRTTAGCHFAPDRDAALEPKEPERTGCDPAYPEERTCIPPGPPFDQGCAITSERLFEVLPPDPQRLDHDGDGIGCEPIRAST